MRKICIFFSFCFFMLSFTFLSHAASKYYSSLPEPINFSNCPCLVYDNGSTPYIVTFNFSRISTDDVFIEVYQSSAGTIGFRAYNYSNVGYDITLSRYNALNGSYVDGIKKTVNSLDSVVLDNYFSCTSLTPYDCLTSLHLPLVSIAWSDSVDPNTYSSWLQNIYIRQGNILQDLEIFYNAFDTFKQVNHYDLTQIYSILSDIYDLLSEDSDLTTAPVDDFSDSVQDYNSVEDQLMVDYQADVDLQFQNSNQVFTGNNAFSLISTTFTDLFVNGNLKLNALILFSLSLGLGVLILGRKLNA